MKLSRRTLLRAGAISTAFGGLANLAACSKKRLPPSLTTDKYGKLIPDPNGILDLPKGFAYKVLSRAGDEMDDGLLVPGDFDGMAAFEGKDGSTILMRNHEINAKDLLKENPAIGKSVSPFGKKDERLDKIDQSRIYDHHKNGRAMAGGVSGLVVDPGPLHVKHQWMALVGTYDNCCGGPTPWGSWISCEETRKRAGEDCSRDHGWSFEVLADPELGLQKPVPLKGLGRFKHEAAAVDPDTGIVYLTQDDWGHPSLLYRFIPDRPGEMIEGGRFQALSIKGSPARDMRNWPVSKGEKVKSNQWMDVEWVDVDESHNPDNDLEERGMNNGAARFTRGEGAWFGEGEMFFATTDGGAAKVGQVWQYVPSKFEGTEFESNEPAKIQLFFESPDRSVMDFCDNLTIAPWGDLIICEDEYSDGDGDNYLRGITPEGKIYTLARSALKKKNEFCGACFGPDKKTLYFNLQQDSLTIAVRGPWHEL
jgi:secreted PhoX family phosphatase